ncbi:MAG: 2-oxoglutarate dehydrogenase complex dihydrolipoyllysine-residue succinyltransferase [Pseudomonadota bacterium]
MAEEVRVPQLGESITEATVGNWLKAAGDKVSADEPIVELETDKVAVEVPSPIAGVLSEIIVSEGETVEVGALLAHVDANGAAQPASAKTSDDKPTKKAEANTDKAAENDGGDVVEAIDVVVPALGESITEATIGNWLKQAGDAVELDEPVAELETDKVAVEVPAPAAGVMGEILSAAGDTVEVGAVIARVHKGQTVDTSAGKAEPKSATSESASKTADDQPAADGPKGSADMPMAPAVRKLIGEHDLDPAKIAASGKDGRLTKGDVLAAIDAGTAKRSGQAASAPIATAPSAQASNEPREERVRMTRLRKRIAERLKEAQNTAAMLTTFNEADMTAVMDLRNDYKTVFEKKHGIKLGFMSFFVKACVHALREVPAVNARIEDDEIIYHNYANIGIAVSAPNGLVVPVLKDAQTMSFADTELAIADFGKRARDGKLALDDLQGVTFSISNGGIFGSLLSAPILNPPQSGILGMHKIQDRPIAMNGQVVIRPMMYLSVSYDHRLIDGREAVTFLVRVKDCLEDPGRLLLDL